MWSRDVDIECLLNAGSAPLNTAAVSRARMWVERLESGLTHAYDVIEIRVPNKKNSQFGVMGL